MFGKFFGKNFENSLKNYFEIRNNGKSKILKKFLFCLILNNFIQTINNRQTTIGNCGN
jgi:hypothetical protein